MDSNSEFAPSHGASIDCSSWKEPDGDVLGRHSDDDNDIRLLNCPDVGGGESSAQSIAESEVDDFKFLFSEYHPTRTMQPLRIPAGQSWPQKQSEGEGWPKEVPFAFPYEDLSTARSIRLLRLQPGAGKDPIVCSLFEVNLDDAPTFAALSYVWGYQYTHANIQVNDQDFRVTENLFSALRRVRLADEEEVLWVDAICIDQGNAIERSSQVKIMRDIYQTAVAVLIWLGPDDERDDLAMSTVQELAGALISSDDLSFTVADHASVKELARSVDFSKLSHIKDDCWKALYNFYELPYFCRTWIIQEIQAGTGCLAMCGQHTVCWQAIELAAFIALQAPEDVLRHITTDRGLANVTYIRALAVPETTLLKRLEQTRGFFATESRDKVFAFLRAEDSVVVDYNTSVRDVFIQSATQMLNEDGLDCLSYALSATWYRDHERSIPSWVPTFSKPFIVPLSRFPNLSAGGSLPDHHYHAAEGVLGLKAVRIDRICTVFPPMSWGTFPLQQNTANWPSELTRGPDHVPTFVDRMWHLYANEKGVYRAQHASSSSRQQTVRQAFAATITAGIGRWGLPRDISGHEAAFQEFSTRLFAMADSFEHRLSHDHFDEDMSQMSLAEDWIGDEIENIMASGGNNIDDNKVNGSIEEEQPIWRRFQRAVQSACNSRCFFETKNEHLGLGPTTITSIRGTSWDEKKAKLPEVQLKDDEEVYEVWIPLGGKTPFVLQPRKQEAGGGYWFCGECYVHGVMEGEALSRSDAIEDIRIW